MAANNKTKSIIEKELVYDGKNLPVRGDQVRILNPKRDQLNKGVIVGQCVDGKLKILTDNNSIVTRLPKTCIFSCTMLSVTGTNDGGGNHPTKNTIVLVTPGTTLKTTETNPDGIRASKINQGSLVKHER